MEELKILASKALFLTRDNSTFLQLMKHLPKNTKPRLFWSMWNGYLKKSRNAKPYAEQNNIPIEYLHTSGHATVQQIEQLIKALKPGKVIPVHTFAPEGFLKIADNLLFLEDRHSVEL